MPILKVITYPDKILRKPAKLIQDIDGGIQDLINDMAETMYAAPGVGLAAIQVGIDKSLLIYDLRSKEEKRSLQVLINPSIIASEGTFISEDEGCLSVPDFRANVKRAATILVEGVDRKGNPLRIEADGFLAVVLQHEIDHLSGKLFIDRISPLKRELYKRHMKKKLKRN
ncbi:MAG: peptide deformylase [Desulfobacterales bacterium]|nr:peptide deformylase [Desulfobacterales bacterium]